MSLLQPLVTNFLFVCWPSFCWANCWFVCLFFKFVLYLFFSLFCICLFICCVLGLLVYLLCYGWFVYIFSTKTLFAGPGFEKLSQLHLGTDKILNWRTKRFSTSPVCVFVCACVCVWIGGQQVFHKFSCLCSFHVKAWTSCNKFARVCWTVFWEWPFGKYFQGTMNKPFRQQGGLQKGHFWNQFS